MYLLLKTHYWKETKNVELLSKVYHQVKHKYTKGFRLLTLGWSDGNTFIPVPELYFGLESFRFIA